MSDIVTRLRHIYSQKDVGVSVNPETFTEAADEIERLRAERLEWFVIARQLLEVVIAAEKPNPAIDAYLRLRGSLEDPRNAQKECTNE